MRTHPGPQKKIRRVNALSIGLYFLLGAFFIVTLYSFLKANLTLLPKSFADSFSIVVLDLNASITLLVVIIGALVARNNLSYNMRPYLVYEVNGIDGPEEKISVLVKNVGAGNGYVKSIDYRYIIDDKDLLKDIDDVSYSSGFQKMQMDFKTGQVLPGTDFLALEITNGYAFTPLGVPMAIFTINKIILSRVIAFDIRIEMTGGLGDTYYKELFCIPRKIHWTENIYALQSKPKEKTK